MKRITVGRSNDCDIVVIDETDNVSRHHLVITFTFFGKMKVSDTSSNGTSINGTRMLKGTSIPVTKDDTIRLGRNIDLDWSLVKDPYRSIRITTIILFSVMIVAAVGIWGWSWYKDKTSIKTNELMIITSESEVDDSWNKDSTAKVAPTITSIDITDKKKTIQSEINSKKKDVRKVNKQKDNVAPITKKKDNRDLDSIAVL